MDAIYSRQKRGGKVLFEIPFRSAMDAADLELLRRELHMTTHSDHKPAADALSLGSVRLEAQSGMFLEPGPPDQAGDAPDAAAGNWFLQCRTWGRPASWMVRAWYLQAALIAHELDATVPLPDQPLGGSSSPALTG